MPEALIEGMVRSIVTEKHGETVADFLLSKLREEWKADNQRPTHECAFIAGENCCMICGITYSEWLKLGQ